MHPRSVLAATASAIVLSTIGATSHAQQNDSSNGAPAMAPKIEDAPAAEPSKSSGFHPHIVTDLRFGVLLRNNTDYFSEADTFGYPIPSTGIGVVGNVGVEIIPRFTLAVAGSYYAEAATRRYAKLSLSSDALILQGRFAVVRLDPDDNDDHVGLGLELVLGGGKYWIREAYSDPSLFAGSITHDASSMGFSAGSDAWFTLGPARFVLGYAYHWVPAGITNHIGGEVRAGGHEITLGVGARF